MICEQKKQNTSVLSIFMPQCGQSGYLSTLILLEARGEPAAELIEAVVYVVNISPNFFMLLVASFYVSVLPPACDLDVSLLCRVHVLGIPEPAIHVDRERGDRNHRADREPDASLARDRFVDHAAQRRKSGARLPVFMVRGLT